MENDVVIRAERLGKKYIIGHESERERYIALRDVIARAARGAWRRTKDMAHGHAIVSGDSTEEFWALKDVSFEVKRGEVLGIIGRNGAGKSTLLKILSRITELSTGRVTINGRVASLLEVGTGFHPELTGRENIFLNGAILGMTKREIKTKFDEIVDFAEIEKFLDTPVKRYSSGMYVRLAFAVAAHLETDILIVDEVLATGDARFQRKCLAKMENLAQGQGARTTLFVSHNMSVVQHLCQRAIVLKDGVIVCDDAPQTAVLNYFSDAIDGGHVDLEHWTDRETTGEARITKLEFDDGANGTLIPFGGNLRIRMRARFDTPLTDPIFGVVIHDASGLPMSDLKTSHRGLLTGNLSDEVFVEVNIQNIRLYPGKYLLSPWIMNSASGCTVDFPRMCASFEISPVAGEIGLELNPRWGKVYIPSEWKIEALSAFISAYRRKTVPFVIEKPDGRL